MGMSLLALVWKKRVKAFNPLDSAFSDWPSVPGPCPPVLGFPFKAPQEIFVFYLSARLRNNF
jgi:hypothetical protein